MKKLLTVEDAAELLSLDLKTLYRMRYKGTGPPAYRIGKYLRYDPDELEAWVKSQRDRSVVTLARTMKGIAG